MSRFSISNIAWPDDCDEVAVSLAASCGFAGIELAPMKVFGPLESVTRERLADYRRRLADLGLAIPALQGITFGVPNCTLFGREEDRIRLADHLRRVARAAGALGVGACVFGALALRDPGSLDPQAAFDSAAAFFRGVASAFTDEGSAIAFEPIAAAYNCRFLTTTADAVRLVKAVDHQGFRLQMDAGCIFANGENAADLVDAVRLAVHFHASEEALAPLGSAGADHGAIASALRAGGYTGWRSAEMRQTPDWRANIVTAHRLMRNDYGE